MAGVLVSNNAWGTLNTSVTQFATDMYLTPGQGDRFPNAVEGVSWFYATLVDEEKNLEIVKVVSRTAEALKVERGVDGTQARAFPAQTRFELRPCAAVFNDKVSQTDFENGIDKLRKDFQTADSALESNLKADIDKIKEDYATNEVLNQKLEDLETNAKESYLTEEDVEERWLPLTGGEVEGDVRVTSKQGGGVTLVGGNLVLQTGTSTSSGQAYGGDINAAGAIYGKYLQATSDVRMKENIERLELGWGIATANAITPIHFTWRNDKSPAIGVMAQQVQTVLPELVKRDRTGRLSVNYGELATICLAAIQDLSREVKELKECLKKS